MTHPLPSPARSIHEHRKATRKMRWWYEHLADYMLANPGATQNDMALYFNKAVSTISTIVNADSFRAYLRARRNEFQKELDSQVRGKLLQVADRGLDQMLETIEKKRDTIPIDVLQRMVEIPLKSLGYGAPTPGGVHVSVNSPGQQTLIPVAVSMGDLEAARLALRNSQSAPPPMITIENASEASGRTSNAPEASGHGASSSEVRAEGPGRTPESRAEGPANEVSLPRAPD